MSRVPAYLPLFGSDYLADTQHLSTEEHGAYLLLMIAAWRQEDCGLPSDDKKLARIVGLSVRKWTQIKDTILEFWTVENDRIYQPRLLKEWTYACKKSEGNRENARKRWSAQPTENNEGAPSDRISDGNAPQPQPQPQGRKKVIEASASIAQNDVSGSNENDLPKNLFGEQQPAPPPPKPELKPEHFVEVWNATASRCGLKSIRDLTPERRQTLRHRINGYSLEDFGLVLRAIERSSFLRGERNWKGCTFDWVIKKSNFQKIIEGNYDD